MSTLKNKSKSELIEEIESLEMQLREFKGNENILLGSEEKFTKTFNSSPSSMIISEIDSGKIIDVNNGFANLVMYSKHELIGKNVFKLHLWVNIKDREKYIKKMRDDKGVSNLEIELRTKAGDIIATLISGEILTIKDKPYLLTSCTDITERKKMEDALRESENHYRTIVRQTPAVLWTSDQNGQTVFISANVEQIYGFTPEEILKLGDRLWFGRIHSEDLASVKAAYETLMKRGVNYDIEYRIQRRDGNWIWIHDRATSSYEIAGTLRADGVFLDITERKRAEEALKESEEKYRELFEAESDALFLIENDTGNIIESNMAAEKLYGYTKKELAKKKNTDLSAELEKTQNLTEQTSPNKEEVVFIPLRYHKKRDGTVFPVEITGRFFNWKGKSVHIAAIRDISERKQSEKQLRESKYLLEQVLNTNPAIIFVKDKDSRVLLANKTMADFYNLSIENVTGLLQSDLHQQYSPEQQEIEKWLADDREVIETGQSKILVENGTDSNKLQHWFRTGKYPVDLSQDQKGVLVISEDITERKQAEEALRESETKYRKLVEQSPTAIQIMTPDGWTIQSNSAFMKLWGFSEEALQKVYEKYNILQDEQARKLGVMPLIEKAFAGEVVFLPLLEYSPPETMETLGFTKIEGRNRWIQARLFPVKNKDGEIINVVLMMEDITERKQVEEALRNSEKKFREMADLSPLVVYEIDINANLTFFNKQASVIFGFSEHDLMSNFNALDRVIPEDRDRAKENMKKIMNGKSLSNNEYTMIRKDGSTFPALVNSNQVLKDDKPVGLRGIIIDITARKLAENKIKESQQRLSSHMNNTPLGSIFWDIDFKVIEWNLSAEKIFGYSKEEALGKHPYKLIVPLEIQGQIDEVFNNLLTQTGGNRSVNENITKDGKRILCDWYNVAITDINGKVTGVASLVEDITERTLTEKKLKESRNQLRSLAERLQMIREEERATVAREIHDDLGQTLTALKMDIAWMKKNTGMTEEIRAAKFDTMLGLADSTIQTVKRIATELRPGILDDLGLLSAIEWQTKEFQNRSGIKCNFEIFVDEFIVRDDISIAVFRIFQESLTNIARHSQATKVTVTIMREDDFLLVEISDNGVGISEEQISSSKSLGLIGMSERVSVFRGKLTISRAAEGGTTVRVSIPIEKA